jgi:hypothetical protein
MKNAKNLTFNQCEQRERNYLDVLNKIRPEEFSKARYSKVNSYATYDALITHQGIESIVEVKIREIESTKFSTAILEMNKINRLKAKQKELAEKGQHYELKYYAFYPKSKKLYIFDLNTTPYFKRSFWANKFTAQGGAGKVQKIMAEFDLDDGIEIDLTKREQKKDNGPKTNPLF